MKIYISLSKIINPPRNTKAYLKNRQAEYSKFYTETNGYSDFLDSIDKDRSFDKLGLADDIYGMGTATVKLMNV